MNNLLEITKQAYLVGFRDARTTPDEINRIPLALNYATKTVKNLTIPVVSSRRELLKGFASNFNDRLDKGDGLAIMDWMIDEFLETL